MDRIILQQWIQGQSGIQLLLAGQELGRPQSVVPHHRTRGGRRRPRPTSVPRAGDWRRIMLGKRMYDGTYA